MESPRNSVHQSVWLRPRWLSVPTLLQRHTYMYTGINQRPLQKIKAMDDYYHHFLTFVSGVGNYPAINADRLSVSTLPNSSLSMPGPIMRTSYHTHTLGDLKAFSDQSMLHISNAGRSRKQSMTAPAFGTEHVKHRRTRSGCFMCRSRRVKVMS